jgi:hypothetical protein
MPKRPKIKLSPRLPVDEPTLAAEPPPEKASKYVRVSMYFLPPVHHELRRIAFEQHRSQHEILQEAFGEWFERYSGKTIHEIVEKE